MNSKPKRPCPFCGNKKHLRQPDKHKPVLTEYFVECLQCHAHGPHMDTPGEAMEMWDMRSKVA